MVAAMDSQKRLPSQESLFLDYVQRLDDHKQGRLMIHIHMSALRPYNRRDHHLRIAANSFETLVKSLQGQLFTLSNSDMLLIFRKDALHDVETSVVKLRFMFGDDPLLVKNGDEEDRFCSWYDADSQYQEILDLAKGMVDQERTREAKVVVEEETKAALRVKQERGEPITPKLLASLEEGLLRADLSNMVRRQYASAIVGSGAPLPVFSELFISIRDLREAMMPGVDLTSNRWLFQHLTSILDRRILSLLNKTDQITLSGDISFNLNIATLLSQEFLAFDDAVTASRRGTMVVELQQIDIFQDLGAFMFAREFIKDRGYRLCIDGLRRDTIGLIDREGLGADMVKLIWTPDMATEDADEMAQLRDLIDHAGGDRVVLCRCDTRQSVDFGQALGISVFQGRYVENLIAEEHRKQELLSRKRRRT
ncbi:EAL domain-containing protein [Magnetospira thiophila]